ncbi:unnamed protein product [Leptidea sinapis]|nr:unnamed protein product [Leptidea sinapis]
MVNTTKVHFAIYDTHLWTNHLLIHCINKLQVQSFIKSILQVLSTQLNKEPRRREKLLFQKFNNISPDIKRNNGMAEVMVFFIEVRRSLRRDKSNIICRPLLH